MDATPVNLAGAIVELLVQRGVRVVHVDEETGTKNAMTNEEIDPPLLSGLELARGKRRWWAAELKLTAKMGIPNEIANRRNAIFYWAYDSVTEPTLMRFLVRDPRNPTNAELADDLARQFNILREKTLPGVMKTYKAMDERLKKMEDMWTKAPELVYRPEEDDIVICSSNRLNAPPKPPYREAEEEKYQEEQEEKLKKFEEADVANNVMGVKIITFLAKVEVRIQELEKKGDEKQKLWESMAHLHEQMTVIFQHLKIKPLDPKKPAAPPKATPGKLPVKMKSPEASKEAPL